MEENDKSDLYSDNLDCYEIYTLIDITNTNETDIYKSDTIEYQQNQNLNLLFQIIGLRTQPINPTITLLENQKMSDFKFSKKYKGNNNVWKLMFYSENHECFNNDMDDVYYLKNDTHGVAISNNLNETIKLKINIFDCYDDVNIYFNKTNK